MSDILLINVQRQNDNIIQVTSDEDTETFQVVNSGIERSLGLYIKKSTVVGTVEYPADKESYIDIHDIFKYGNRSEGLYYLDSNGTKHYFSRSSGSKPSNKIDLGNFASGETRTFEIGFDQIADLASRRFFIDIVVE